ncbi:hypothetical protein NPIL_567321 [Nephila pilipes]|uniref:Uncharacterized protein n=1 Tax=Nephila pilipes TaxID=299642 RepID=A0A8X6TSS7_NEPPI|nr:hypothetical protein NPIL_567321 [Nephila pilipes]
MTSSLRREFAGLLCVGVAEKMVDKSIPPHLGRVLLFPYSYSEPFLRAINMWGIPEWMTGRGRGAIPGSQYNDFLAQYQLLYLDEIFSFYIFLVFGENVKCSGKWYSDSRIVA